MRFNTMVESDSDASSSSSHSRCKQIVEELQDALKQEPKMEPEPRLWMPSPSTAVVVKGNPEGTPRGSIKPKRVLENSIYFAPLEKAAECDLDEEEAYEYYEHVRLWVSELPPLENPEGDSDGSETKASVKADDPLQPRPSGACRTSESFAKQTGVLSTLWKTAAVRRRGAETVAEGSEFDSDFDDEYNLDEIADCAGVTRDIPDDEELDESSRNIVNSIERAMDYAIDQMIGVPSEFHWEEDFSTFRGVQDFFSGPIPGPVKDYETPYDAFTDIWSEDIMEHIVKETNRYAKQVMDAKTEGGKLLPKSRLQQWSETDKDEMYVLLAVYMFMGLDPRISQQEYWKTTGYLEMPTFRDLMTYNRYILLNKFIHFVDNSVASQNLPQSGGIVSSVKLLKIAPVVRHLNKKFQTLYNLHPDIAIDESLTLFKGRLSWIQGIRTKTERFGVKSYELCESSTGYLFRFKIDSGKNSESGHFVTPSLALAGRVVMDLLKGLEHRGHCVTMDNFYNCPVLARHLKSLGFDCLGTLRPSRQNVPADVRACKNNMPTGTIVARHAGDVACITWKDNKLVNMISTYHNPGIYVGRKAGKNQVKPVVVRDYNSTIGGLDLKDQKLSMYLLERKRCGKWYLKIFKRLLNVSVHNAFVLFLGSLKRRKMPPITHRDFREKLAESLVATHRKTKTFIHMARPVGEVIRLRNDLVHIPKCVRRESRRNCHICQRKGIRKTIKFKCATCNEFMCFENCWTDYHSLENLPGKDFLVRKRKHV